jgi:hypothetical protein
MGVEEFTAGEMMSSLGVVLVIVIVVFRSASYELFNPVASAI